MKYFHLLYMVLAVALYPLAEKELSGLKPGTLLYVTASALKIRETPELKGKQIGTMKKGDSFRSVAVAGSTVSAEGISSRWIKISFNGKNGFVFAGFVSPKKPELLYTQEEIAGFDRENQAYEKELADREQELMKEYEARGDFYQNCDPCRHYKVNYRLEINKAGCTAEKKSAIKAIMDNGNKSIWEATREFGDEYCTGLAEESSDGGSQCGSVPFFE